MDITWLGNACFRLSADDVVVVTDPFPESVGLRPDMRPATVVTVSHRDPNRSNWKDVPGDPKVFAAPGEYEYRGIGVRGVMTPLPADTPQEDRSVAFAIEIGGVTICHMGSVNSPPTPSQIDELSPVDVLLIPAGGGATMGVEQVFQTMQDLSPQNRHSYGRQRPRGSGRGCGAATGNGGVRAEDGPGRREPTAQASSHQFQICPRTCALWSCHPGRAPLRNYLKTESRRCRPLSQKGD